MDDTTLLDHAIAFHGHFCPGLLIGFRAALIGLRELGVTRAQDEELVAIAETDACGVDAPLPGPARIFKSVQCSQCGEGVMEARANLRDGQPVCPECYGEVYTRRLA